MRNCILALLVVLAWQRSAAGQTCNPGFVEYGQWCVLGEPPDRLKCQVEVSAAPPVRRQYCTSAIESKQQTGAKLATLLSARAETYVIEGDFASAIADDSAAIQALQAEDNPAATNGDLYSTLRARAEAYEKTGNIRLALADLGEMVKREPKFASGWRLRGELYARTNDCRHAIADFDKALQLQSQLANSGEVYFERALCHGLLGDQVHALADCRDAQRNRPDFTSGSLPEICDAVIALKLKQFARAATTLADYVTSHPNNAYALYGRGIARLNRGDRAGGTADIAAAKAMDQTVAGSFARIGLTEQGI